MSTQKKKKSSQQVLKKDQKRKERTFLSDTITALVLFGLTACCLVCFFMPESSPFTRFVTGTLRGMFGIVGYLVPVLLVFAGVMRMFSRKRILLKVLVALLFFVLLSSFINVIVYDTAIADATFSGYVADLWEKGRSDLFSSGGVLGGALAVPLVLFADKAIAGIAVFVVMAALFAYVTGLSFADFIGTPEERMEARLEKEEEKQKRREAEKAERRKAEAEEKNRASEKTEEPKEVRNDRRVHLMPESLIRPDKPEEKEIVAEKTHAPAEEPVPEEETITKEDILRAKREVETEISASENAEPSESTYVFPPLDLLAKGDPAPENDEAELYETGEKLCEVLRSFSVDTHVVDASRGPTVTRYELAPEAGVRISRITNLADDIALSLAAKGVRIEAPIPGKSAVGIEVPNLKPRIVHLREVLDTEKFRRAESRITVALGKNIAGEDVIIDIDEMPHLLVGGATGTGKSVCVNSMLISFLYKADPSEVKLILIDPKMVEFNVFRGIPHLLVPVVTDPKKAAGALAWAVMEMDARYEKIASKNARNIHGYNANLLPGEKKLPEIVIVIDELADLMMASPKEVEDSVARLAQKARAAGMHLIIATQRPSADVVTGLIKANIPSCIALAVSSGINSRIILDTLGAEKLLGKGDMLYAPIGSRKPTRLQGCFVSDKEVENIVGFIKKNSTQTDYDPDIEKKIEKAARDQQNKGKGVMPTEDGDGDGEVDDAMLEKAIETVVDMGMASTSMLQRRIGLGYARAARIVDVMEKRHIVGPYQGSKPRDVLISRQQWDEMKLCGLKEPRSDAAPAAEEIPADTDGGTGDGEDA